MKVNLPKDYKRYFTIEDLETAKEIMKYEKEDTFTAKDYAEMAAREALKGESDYFEKVLEADATICKEARVWNTFSETSGHMDVWIRATVRTAKGFIDIGACVSDIWQTGAADYKEHMYIVKYMRAS